MALQKCGLNLNRDRKELQPHGSADFPCAGYDSYHTERPEDVIPWHWHQEIEIIYIAEGRMEIKVPAKSYILNQGDMAAINSNVLHYASALGECRLHSLVFSPQLIAGNSDSVFAKKYMDPLLSCEAFSGLPVWAGKKNITALFNAAFEALAQDTNGFEFIVRENFSRICFYLWGLFSGQLHEKADHFHQDTIRIRRMIEYIQKNFARNLPLSEIAASANISERECLRCFQKTIQTSPVQYLLKYRVMQGAEMLRQNQGRSISEIAADCGFESPSNFAKIFRRFYNCTPREFREKKR